MNRRARLDPAVAARRIGETAATMCAKRGTLEQRKRVALFVGTLRGHAIVESSFVEQPFGYLAKCSDCEMGVLVPRDREIVDGRAVENDCPKRPR